VLLIGTAKDVDGLHATLGETWVFEHTIVLAPPDRVQRAGLLRHHVMLRGIDVDAGAEFSASTESGACAGGGAVSGANAGVDANGSVSGALCTRSEVVGGSLPASVLLDYDAIVSTSEMEGYVSRDLEQLASRAVHQATMRVDALAAAAAMVQGAAGAATATSAATSASAVCGGGIGAGAGAGGESVDIVNNTTTLRSTRLTPPSLPVSLLPCDFVAAAWCSVLNRSLQS
jgi:hypothetical protein